MFAACRRSDHSSLVGSWVGRAMNTDGLLEMAGEVQFASDHTFKGREWDATHRLSDSGEWHVRGGKLVLNFRRAFDPLRPTQVESFLTIEDHDHFTLRQAHGAKSTFERLK